MKDFIELRRVLAIITRQLRLLVFLTAVAALTGLLFSRSQTPVYQATTTMLVGQLMQTISVNRTDIQTSADVAKTYADIALRQPVLDEVVGELGLEETWQDLKKQVQVKAIEGTQLIEVTAEADSAKTARSIADSVANQLIALSPTTTGSGEYESNYEFIRKQLDSLKQRLTDGHARLNEIEAALTTATSESDRAQLEHERTTLEQLITEWEKNYVDLSGLASQERASNNYLTIIEPAQSTRSPVRPRVLLDTIIAGGVGLLLALALALLSASLDSSIHSREQLEELLGLAPLAVIGAVRRSGLSLLSDIGGLPLLNLRARGDAIKVRKMAAHRLVTLQQPRSPESESFRALRTNVQLRSTDRSLHSLVVTSAAPREGKTFVAANLAVVMAQAGKRVVLVDADLRRPSLHTLFDLPNNSGFTSLILEGSSAKILQTVRDIPNLFVITSGPLPPNPSELLDSERVAQVMGYLAEHTDVVIYDSPPTGLVTDPSILAAKADAVMLVVHAGVTHRDLVLNAKQSLQNLGVKAILPVLNQLKAEDGTSNRWSYRRYYTGDSRRFSFNGHREYPGEATVRSGEIELPAPQEHEGNNQGEPARSNVRKRAS